MSDREAFEKWMSVISAASGGGSEPKRKANGHYKRQDIQGSWIAFKAGMQAARAQGDAEPVAWLDPDEKYWLDQGGIGSVVGYEIRGHIPLCARPPAAKVPEGCMVVSRALVERWAKVDAFNAPRGAAMELKSLAEMMLCAQTQEGE